MERKRGFECYCGGYVIVFCVVFIFFFFIECFSFILMVIGIDFGVTGIRYK